MQQSFTQTPTIAKQAAFSNRTERLGKTHMYMYVQNEYVHMSKQRPDDPAPPLPLGAVAASISTCLFTACAFSSERMPTWPFTDEIS